MEIFGAALWKLCLLRSTQEAFGVILWLSGFFGFRWKLGMKGRVQYLCVVYICFAADHEEGAPKEDRTWDGQSTYRAHR